MYVSLEVIVDVHRLEDWCGDGPVLSLEHILLNVLREDIYALLQLAVLFEVKLVTVKDKFSSGVGGLAA